MIQSPIRWRLLNCFHSPSPRPSGPFAPTAATRLGPVIERASLRLERFRVANRFRQAASRSQQPAAVRVSDPNRPASASPKHKSAMQPNVAMVLCKTLNEGGPSERSQLHGGGPGFMRRAPPAESPCPLPAMPSKQTSAAYPSPHLRSAHLLRQMGTARAQS